MEEFDPTQFKSGIIEVEKTEEEKQKEWKHEEVAGSVPIKWVEKTKWKVHPIKKQYYTFECVAQTYSKISGVLNEQETGDYVDLSPEYLYRHRTTSGGGMAWDDVMNIGAKKGTCKFNRIPQRFRESDPYTPLTQEMIDEALIYANDTRYYTAQNITMDTIAQMIETNGAIMLWFYFDANGQEWWKIEPKVLYPNLNVFSPEATRHSVTAEDYGLRNGKKVIPIQDSAGNDTAQEGQIRFIDEDFLKRCYRAGYPINKKNLDYKVDDKPKYYFRKSLRYGMRDEDVRMLQKVLVYEGVMEIKNPTINFLGATLKAVKLLQEKYRDEILTPVGLKFGTGFVGASTLKFLNNKYK